MSPNIPDAINNYCTQVATLFKAKRNRNTITDHAKNVIEILSHNFRPPTGFHLDHAEKRTSLATS